MTFRPGRFLRQAWKETRYDLKNIRWNGPLLGKILLSVLVLMWTSGLVAIPIVVVLVQRGAWQVACTPDGQFHLDPGQYRYWSRTGFFQITLTAVSELSFEKAKLIDIAWDVGIGRVGQALLAFFSWRVFALYVTTSMETAPITYQSYRAVFLETGPSFWSTILVIWDFFHRKRLHSSIAMAFMVVTMVFTLCFPTFASAMTGYTSIVKAYVPDHQDGNWIRFDRFTQVLYTIHDGDRVGQTKNYLVTDETYGVEPTFTDGPMELSCTSLRWPSENYHWNASYIVSIMSSRSYTYDCLVQNNVSKYVEQYGFEGVSQESSIFMEHDLDAPALNISTSYFYDPTLYGSIGSFEKQDQKKRLWMWANETYDYDYLSQNAMCQSSGRDYRWGFSSVQLFCMDIMLLVWTLGILIMCWRAQTTMMKRGRDSVTGTHKAVLELAAAMSRELEIDVNDLKVVSEDQVQERIAEVHGGRISYDSSLLIEKQLPDTSLRRWLVENTWWYLVTWVFVVTSSFVWGWDLWFCFWTLGPTVGLLCALCIGTTPKSRSVMISVFTILSSVPMVILQVLIAVGAY